MKRRNWLILGLAVALVCAGILACGESKDGGDGDKRSCTTTLECKGGEVCGLDGYCATMTYCTSDEACGYGNYCTAQQFCQVATPCETAFDCNDTSLDCTGGFCLPKVVATGCNSDADCAFDEYCHTASRTCLRRTANPDGDEPDGDTPADGDEPDGDEPDGDTPTPVCGNGNLESGEECENNDHCTGGKTCNTITCECEGINPPVCGNGTLESGEECENDSHCTGGKTCHTDTCTCQGGTTGMQAILCNKIPASAAAQLCLIFNGTYTLQASAETCGTCTAFAAMATVSAEMTDCAGGSFGTLSLDPVTAGTDWLFLLELDGSNANVSYGPIESPNTCADVTYNQVR